MLLLAIGLALFFTVHLVPTAPGLRAGLVDRFGRVGYAAAFSVLSVVALAIIVIGYQKLQLHPGKNPQLWLPPVWTKHLAFTLMLPAMILLVAAYVPSNIRTAAKHPMLLAVKIWALAHLLANGDLAGVVLFGSFLAFAIYDRISVKHRSALGPLGAAQPSWIGDAIAIAVGFALFAFMLLWGHQHLIGKALLATSFAR